MSKVRNYSKERKALQKQGLAPAWMTTNGWQLFSEKYLNGECKTPFDQYKRIANQLAKYAPEEYPSWWSDIDYWKGKTWEDAFFSVLWDGYISASTPLLTNTGTDYGMSVSCSGSYVGDSISDFYQTRKDNALLTKEGFGTSVYLGDIRSRGSKMKNGEANGAQPVAEMFVDDAKKVSQG
jgi:ribonucleoside-diphosphate reductase alpha chain